MTDLSELYGPGGTILLIMALVKATNWVLHLERRWLPLVAVAWGVALNVTLATQSGMPYVTAVVLGMMAGLSAVGLYSGVKNVRGK